MAFYTRSLGTLSCFCDMHTCFQFPRSAFFSDACYPAGNSVSYQASIAERTDTITLANVQFNRILSFVLCQSHMMFHNIEQEKKEKVVTITNMCRIGAI